MKIRTLILIASFSLASITLAQAHAFLDHAEPRVGSTVHPAPTQVKVYLTEEVEPAFSTLQVFDAKGAEIDKKDSMVMGASMMVSLPTLSPGTYKVVWKAVAIDTHKTSGTFDFTVQ